MKEQTTGFAGYVATIARNMSQGLTAAYYRLTAHYPRLLPRSEEEVNKLKTILVQHFGLKDEPQVWTAVFGQMCSVKPTSVRKPYSHYVNVARRLDINNIANGLKGLEIMKLQVKLQEKLKEQGLGNMREGTFDHQGELPSLQPLEEGVVQPSGASGIQ